MSVKDLPNTEPEHYITTPKAEPWLERLVFGNRGVFLLVLLLLTAFLGFNASKVGLDSRSEKYIPLEHEYIKNHLRHANDLSSGLNNVKVVVEAKQGDIFNAEYMETLRQINDEIFFINGSNRSKLKSLWTPNVRWTEVTEQGFQGGPVIPATYNGSDESIEQLRENILKSGQVGRLVANNFQSTMIDVPLYETDPETGEPLDPKKLSEALEEKVRDKYASDKIAIHIIGFPKKMADLMEGAYNVALFFLGAIAITAVLLFVYSRCLRGTLIPVVCSFIAVIWQLGLLNLIGFGIDPYSMLVPFLVFAIGISHGVQIINGIAIEAGKGAGKEMSARLAFRGLYVPGMLALLSDAIGFLTLLFIQITVIRELAIAASIGVAVIIVTNLILLPLLMSYVGISRSGVNHAEKVEKSEPVLWKIIAKFTQSTVAVPAILVAIALAVVGVIGSQDLKIGDLDKGAPELRQDSRYNQDNAYVVDNYSTSSDVLVIMAETPREQCASFEALDAMDRLMWTMENVKGVQSTVSLVSVSKLVTKGMNEGNPNWSALSRNQNILNSSIQRAPSGMLNTDCSMVPVLIFLNDHKAETLERAVNAASEFAAEYENNEAVQFKLASGNAGVEAATNQVIEKAQTLMLIFVYIVVSALCFMTFRSVRAVICIITPLALTSILCQALMAQLGIGVKVATLPVIALGVGIGVDYGIYIYSRLEAWLIEGKSLHDAYFQTLKTTGKAVSFTGLTLAIGVGTWIWSPIKFQADMGVLLTFMFIWNMIGALLLLPALARYVLRPERIIAKHIAKHGDNKPAENF
ncbi:RND family transporter [Bermanella marisrubri]|uniref:Predicted exporters of the RND superfamily protein n=1 Tax=Bermanella marisrubri TaxID=207949 RepID=Q1N0L0_9GAMM|nr:MMPL family transporter [Bermanella marisrubri]EAT11823.1 predicted exporters of the RND superfamily protein [Oceanobacter sp. RED65] [Bermanella marisrubri]QIZ83857.1 RND family transporter [Bermanella marisrubri]